MLLDKYIKIRVNGETYKYYESIGYNIPRKENNKIDTKSFIEIKTEDLPKGSGIKVHLMCDCCGKITKDEYRHYLKCNHNLKTYCNKCALKLFNSGENNPNWGNKYTPTGKDNPSWNPNLTQTERESNRNYKEYTQFVKKVMNRDNYTCQCCGNKLNHDGIVHHLDGYNWCVEKRTDETNGITLCENCHKNFHSIYGKGNNTKEQFEEWIGRAITILNEGKLIPTKRIYCLEENKIYNSVKELMNEWNLKEHTTIYAVCNHSVRKRKRKNKPESTYEYVQTTVKGKHIMWFEEAVEKGYLVQ